MQCHNPDNFAKVLFCFKWSLCSGNTRISSVAFRFCLEASQGRVLGSQGFELEQAFWAFCCLCLCPLSTGGNTIERWFTEKMISFREVRKLLLDNTYGKQPSRTLKIIKARWCIRRNVWHEQINLTVFKRTVSKLSLLALICRSLSACVCGCRQQCICARERGRERQCVQQRMRNVPE